MKSIQKERNFYVEHYHFVSEKEVLRDEQNDHCAWPRYCHAIVTSERPGVTLGGRLGPSGRHRNERRSFTPFVLATERTL